MKTCSKCGETKPLDAFGVHRSSADGLRSECRPCRVIRQREYCEADPDYPEKERTRSAKRRVDNPEEARLASARYYVAHVEAAAEKQRRQRAAHPEKNSVQLSRRRARKLAAPGRGVTTAEWLEILALADGICTYCHEPAKLTMDHIVPLILGGAHDVDNIAAACQPCNSSKGARPLAEFLQRRAA